MHLHTRKHGQKKKKRIKRGKKKKRERESLLLPEGDRYSESGLNEESG